MSDGITDMRDEEINKLKDNDWITSQAKELEKQRNEYRGENESLRERNEVLEKANHKLWDMNNILEISMKGHEKIIMDYPILEKKLEKIQEIIKEYRDDTAIRLIKELLENKK